MRKLDIKTRGIYIALACDIERMLDDIITYCEEPNFHKQVGYKRDKVMSLEMGKKISRCMDSVEVYNSQYYQTYLPQFNIVKELVVYRNIMAHGYSEYDPHQIDEQHITFYNKEKSRIAKYVIEPREFIKNMKTLQETVMKLVNLIIILARERGQPPSAQP